MTIYTNNKYYEAILQLRPRNLALIKLTLDYIKDGNFLISKEIDKKFGLDLYLNNKRGAISIARKLKKRFKGEIKLSRKLYSVDRMTSKRLWRVTVLFRLNEE